MHAATKNRVAAAYAGTIGENIGYYGFIIARDLARSLRKHRAAGKALSRTTRNLLLEFGLSELLDSLLVRPFCMFAFPLLLKDYVIGIIAGKLAADVIFYIPTIIAYELHKKHLDD
jgi:hypothetical protein